MSGLTERGGVPAISELGQWMNTDIIAGLLCYNFLDRIVFILSKELLLETVCGAPVTHVSVYFAEPRATALGAGGGFRALFRLSIGTEATTPRCRASLV